MHAYYMCVCVCAYNVYIYIYSLERNAAAAAAKLLQLCLTLCDPTDGQPTRLLHPWDSPGKNTGVGCHCLLHWKGVGESNVGIL